MTAISQDLGLFCFTGLNDEVEFKSGKHAILMSISPEGKYD